MDKVPNHFREWLEKIRQIGASINVDILDGLEVSDIKRILSPACLSLPDETIEMWRIFGGTQQPKDTDPAFVEKRYLDAWHIFFSPEESLAAYQHIHENTELGFDDFLGFPQYCLPIARSVGADFVAVDCSSSLSTRGSLYIFDPTTGELFKMANSVDTYFETITKAYEEGTIGLDLKNNLDVLDFDMLFSLARRMNPTCDYWKS